MNLRKIAGFACALTLAAPVGLMLGNGSATGATPAQTCGSLKGSATITPGLTTVPHDQTIAATGNLASCTPSAATGGTGVMHASVKIHNGSCQGLASGSTLPLVGSIKWKNTKTSGLKITAKTSSAHPTTATITGKVTSGLFLNAPVTGTITFSIVNTGSGAPCSATNPVKKITFVNKDANGHVVKFVI